jgi:hypothetical protein
MSFSRWLRTNSEHYLLIAAQDRVAREYGVSGPRRPRGAKEVFWLRVFAPAYRLLPWGLRRRIIQRMPGSHRRSWPAPPKAAGPAI